MAAHQAPPSLGFSRQEHWSGLPFPSPMHESEKWKWSCSRTAAYQAPPSMGLSRQEYWSGVPLPSPIPPFKENGLPFWVPGVLHQHSKVVLWKLLNIQMIFWWICGGESGLPVLFLCHLGSASQKNFKFSAVHCLGLLALTVKGLCLILLLSPGSFCSPCNSPLNQEMRCWVKEYYFIWKSWLTEEMVY